MNYARKMVILFPLLVAGCGYQEYMERFEDTLAENDYSAKVENALGAPVSDPKRGFSIRLPKTVSPTPISSSGQEEGLVPVVQVGEEQISAVHHTIFSTPEDAEIPMRVVVFASIPNKDYPVALDWAQLGGHVLDPSYRGEWMGDGDLTSGDELKPDLRDIPAGPKLKSDPQKKISIRWASLEQQGEEDKEYIWLLGFLEQPKASAMIGFRVAKSDYTKTLGKAAEDGTIATVSDAIDMSLTTAKIEVPLTAATASEAGSATPGRSGRSN